ncbi:MAG: hypothetical protein JST19_21435 [Bacteroidetes bacterium]|nr:hypothetical protein [Bacteroidota bacterium]
MEDIIEIRDLSKADRPREKLMTKGTAALTNAELLAVLLGRGVPGHPILTLCNQLAESVGNDISILARLTYNDFCKIKGIGPAKALILIAALELGERRNVHEKGMIVINDEKDLVAALGPYFKKTAEQLFLLVLINQRKELLAIAELKRNEFSYPDLPAILKQVVEAGATGFWIARSPARLNKEKSWVKSVADSAKMMSIVWYGRVIIKASG